MAITEQEKRRQQKRTDLILLFLFYLIGAVFSIHLGAVFVNYPEFDIVKQLDPLLRDVTLHMQENPLYLPDSASNLKAFYFYSLIYLTIFCWYLSSRKKMMPGKEHGSARWAGPREIKRLMNLKDKSQNIILTATEGLSLNMRKIRKNLNVMVVGSSGDGKTRFFIKPNIMQLHTNYIITDPKGEILRDTGAMLEKHGYRIKAFNLIDMAHSCCYSPFNYINSDEDIEKMIKCLIKNTTPPNSNSNDPFWEKAELLLLEALCSFIHYKLPEDEQNFSTVLRMLRMLKVYEEDENYEADLDILFKTLEEEDPDNPAVMYYHDFKVAAGKTLKSIMISVNARLSVFNIPRVANLTHKDTLELKELTEEKMALFLIIPDNDSTFNFLVAMLYEQMLRLFGEIAFMNKNGMLKRHVRFLLDEFANIGEIPDFDKHLSVMRSKNFSACPILQDITQLDKFYKNTKNSIIVNCNTKLYLGGDENNSAKYFSEMLGKETIDVKTYNNTRGRQRSIAENYQKVGRELMTADEIGTMPDSDCILKIKGCHPWYSKKYDLKKHPLYNELYDEKSGEDYFYDYRRFVTPERPQKKKLEVRAVKKPTKSNETNLNIKDLELNINSIDKLRYALEFELS